MMTARRLAGSCGQITGTDHGVAGSWFIEFNDYPSGVQPTPPMITFWDSFMAAPSSQPGARQRPQAEAEGRF
jgi:hypothetical protein